MMSPARSRGVAQMAASGLSNQEIAERLFLSHRTVASHLYHVYPKLGVTSRNQLHVALQLPSTAPPGRRLMTPASMSYDT
jgi:DNA-binding NarL/FixJ family response regulator